MSDQESPNSGTPSPIADGEAPVATDSATPDSAGDRPETTQPQVSSTLPGYDVKEGLFEFYSSQAKAMLLQYDSINTLLGPTDDWTGPGTLCEVMIRDLLRRCLTSKYSVDKGFIFGRRMKDGTEVHSPEIDVLVHDSHRYRPIYRLDDFVIVQPEAVIAIIQVKRTLTSLTLKKAIENLVDAKFHLRDCRLAGGGDEHSAKMVYSAAVFFADSIQDPMAGGISTTYRSRLTALKNPAFVRPYFVGSLSKRFYLHSARNNSYMGFSSTHNDQNAALSILLASLSSQVFDPTEEPPFFIPPDFLTNETISLH